MGIWPGSTTRWTSARPRTQRWTPTSTTSAFLTTRLADLHALVELKNRANNRSRVVAGYCWKWPSKKDAQAWDIELPQFDYRRRWNLDKDGSLWIVTPGSVEQVGCIHTCQGLELDYVGVIIGPDLAYRCGASIWIRVARQSG